MPKTRTEAFSDGVIAIIMTVMVLELKVPHGHTWEALSPRLPVFLSYVLSFMYLGIYWSCHHHLLAVTKYVNGIVMWANLHLLFWLSLLPFGSGWLAESDFSPDAVRLYGTLLLCSSFAFLFLQWSIIHAHAEEQVLLTVAHSWKPIVSAGLLLAGIGLTYLSEWVGLIYYSIAAGMWFLPDSRLERTT